MRDQWWFIILVWNKYYSTFNSKKRCIFVCNMLSHLKVTYIHQASFICHLTKLNASHLNTWFLFILSLNTFLQHTYNQHHLSFTIFHCRTTTISILDPSVYHTTTIVCPRNLFKHKPRHNLDRRTFSYLYLFMLLLYDTQAKNLSFITEIGGLRIEMRWTTNMREQQITQTTNNQNQNQKHKQQPTTTKNTKNNPQIVDSGV